MSGFARISTRVHTGLQQLRSQRLPPSPLHLHTPPGGAELQPELPPLPIPAHSSDEPLQGGVLHARQVQMLGAPHARSLSLEHAASSHAAGGHRKSRLHHTLLHRCGQAGVRAWWPVSVCVCACAPVHTCMCMRAGRKATFLCLGCTFIQKIALWASQPRLCFLVWATACGVRAVVCALGCTGTHKHTHAQVHTQLCTHACTLARTHSRACMLLHTCGCRDAHAHASDLCQAMHTLRHSEGGYPSSKSSSSSSGSEEPLFSNEGGSLRAGVRGAAAGAAAGHGWIGRRSRSWQGCAVGTSRQASAHGGGRQEDESRRSGGEAGDSLRGGSSWHGAKRFSGTGEGVVGSEMILGEHAGTMFKRSSSRRAEQQGGSVQGGGGGSGSRGPRESEGGGTLDMTRTGGMAKIAKNPLFARSSSARARGEAGGLGLRGTQPMWAASLHNHHSLKEQPLQGLPQEQPPERGSAHGRGSCSLSGSVHGSSAAWRELSEGKAQGGSVHGGLRGLAAAAAAAAAEGSSQRGPRGSARSMPPQPAQQHTFPFSGDLATMAALDGASSLPSSRSCSASGAPAALAGAGACDNVAAAAVRAASGTAEHDAPPPSPPFPPCPPPTSPPPPSPPSQQPLAVQVAMQQVPASPFMQQPLQQDEEEQAGVTSAAPAATTLTSRAHGKNEGDLRLEGWHGAWGPRHASLQHGHSAGEAVLRQAGVVDKGPRGSAGTKGAAASGVVVPHAVQGRQQGEGSVRQSIDTRTERAEQDDVLTSLLAFRPAHTRGQAGRALMAQQPVVQWRQWRARFPQQHHHHHHSLYWQQWQQQLGCDQQQEAGQSATGAATVSSDKPVQMHLPDELDRWAERGGCKCTYIRMYIYI